MKNSHMASLSTCFALHGNLLKFCLTSQNLQYLKHVSKEGSHLLESVFVAGPHPQIQQTGQNAENTHGQIIHESAKINQYA